jgi:hypothetical protein
MLVFAADNLKMVGHSLAGHSRLGHCYHIPVLRMTRLVADTLLMTLRMRFRTWVRSTAATDVLWKHDTPL